MENNHEAKARLYAYQRCRVLVAVQRNQTQTDRLHRQHMRRLCPHNPLQQGHQLVGIETLISDRSEVGGEQKAT